MRINLSILLFGLSFHLVSASERPVVPPNGGAIIREINLARQNPALYATFVEELRPYFHDNALCCRDARCAGHAKAFARSMKRRDFCAALNRNQR